MNIKHLASLLLVALSGLCFANEPVCASAPPQPDWPALSAHTEYSFTALDIAVFDKATGIPFPALPVAEVSETRIIASAPVYRGDASNFSIFYGGSRLDRLHVTVSGERCPMYLG